MKKQLLLGISVFALSLASCSDEWSEGKEAGGAGFIVPLVDVDSKTISSFDTGTRADLTSITKEDLTLVLSKNDGTPVWEGKYEEFPVDRQFGIGSYILEAKYGDPADEGFDKPALYGSQTLAVTDGNTTETSLTVTPANSQVTVMYTESFQKYMTDWSATVNNVEFVKDEERFVFVKPGGVTIRINVEKPNSVKAQFTLDKVEAQARYCYRVIVDLNNGETGDAVLKVTFDENFNEEEVEIDLSDKVLNSPLPEMMADGFESNVPIEIISGLTGKMDLSMSMVAQAGIKGVNLKTNSQYLKSLGWPEEIDLLTASSEEKGLLERYGLGVLGLWKNVGEMGYLEFTDLVSNIQYVEGEDNAVSFQVAVKDKLMRESEPVILSLNISPIILDLSCGDNYIPGEQLKVKLNFNGTKEDFEKKGSIQYFDASGRWRALEVVEVEDDGDGQYSVTINPPAVEDNLQLRAVVGEKVSNEVEVSIEKLIVSVTPENSFATFAYVKIEKEDGTPAVNVSKLQIKADGASSYTSLEVTPVAEEEGYYKVSTLTSAKSYTVRANKKSPEASFTTETPETVPNGDFETEGKKYDDVDMNQGGPYVAVVVRGQNKADFSYIEPMGWTTTNEKTMSGTNRNTWYVQPSAFTTKSYYIGKGSGVGNLDNRNSEEYTFEPYKGDASIVIRNIGWHPAGTDIASKSTGASNAHNSTVPDTYYKEIGKIFLGTYNYKGGNEEDIIEGIDFASRPSSLKGYYRYALNNDIKQEDKAEIIIKICHDDEVISQNSVQLGEVSEFKDFEIPLFYPIDAKKANKVCVMIKSSILSESEIEVSPYNNRYKSYFHGATLVVDDLEFVY